MFRSSQNNTHFLVFPQGVISGCSHPLKITITEVHGGHKLSIIPEMDWHAEDKL